MEAQKKIAKELEQFQLIRNQLKKIITQRKQLEIQLNENKMVKEEFNLISDQTKVFKLIGPALVKVDLKDAKENVNNRIKYITEELKRHDQTLETLSKQQEKHREAVMKLEQLVKPPAAATIAK